MEPKQRCRIIPNLCGDCKYPVKYPKLPNCYDTPRDYLRVYQHYIYGTSGANCPCFKRGEPDSWMKETKK